jgi:hypothetical protein
MLINQNIDAQLCMYMKITTTTTTQIILFWTIPFFSFKFVQCKCHFQKATLKNP